MRKIYSAFAMIFWFATNSLLAGEDAAPTIPHFTASQRCPGDGSPEMKYDCELLEGFGALDLNTSPGTRVYRETWSSGFKGPLGSASITLTIAVDGSKTLRTSWNHSVYNLKPSDLADFEATLSKSSFAQRTVYNRRILPENEVCVDGVETSIEAIVDGRYRLVVFDACGGVFDENIADALDQLTVFAENISGSRFPWYPDHPTFRG
jgi:hypothetical protein